VPKKDKAMEVKKSVMSDKRRIASLFLEFKKLIPDASATPEMLRRQNFDELIQAIQTYTVNASKDVKAGLKAALYYLLKKFATIAKASHLMRNRDDEAGKINKFLDVLALNKKLVFGDATYILNRNRNENLCRPQALPSEADVNKLKTYIVDRMATLTGQSYVLWDKQSYAELRDVTVCRLTLFNARRGGEPARMLASEWHDAEKDAWLQQPSDADKEDLSRFHGMKVAYQSGKGNNHLVPVLIPNDTVLPMQILADTSIREMASVFSVNAYMFPVVTSDSHVSGWHAVNRTCINACIEKPESLTATKMRHRVSTVYAGLEVPDSERQLFYKHMGHSAEVNIKVYQAPLAEQEICHIGRTLKYMDGQLPTATVSRASSLCSEEPVDNSAKLATDVCSADVAAASA